MKKTVSSMRYFPGRDMKTDCSAKPRVFIEPQASMKLEAYVDAVDVEISGFGIVQPLPPDAFLIKDVFIFKQVCDGGETDLSGKDSLKDISLFLIEAVKRGIDPGTIKLWWHSHVDMDVFWSRRDEQTAGLFKNGYMLSLVANKHREYRCRLDMFSPVRFTVDELPFGLWLPRDPVIDQTIKREVAEKVTVRQVKPLIPSSLITPWPYDGLKGEDDE